MKVAIVGAGALGCLFGARLVNAGYDVSLLHYRQSYVTKLNEGLILEEIDGETTEIEVKATVDASSVGHADVVIVLVKAHQTETALKQHAECIGPETDVLSLQNGLRHYDRLLGFVGEKRALAGVTYQGAVVEEPGYIRVTSSGTSTIGGVNQSAISRISSIFEDAGLPVECVDDPRPSIWKKQVVSLPIKPLAALTQLSNGELVTTAETRALMEQIVDEAQRVATSQGIDMQMDDPMSTVIEACQGSSSHYSSMLQDVWEERKTEIDEVNGAVVDIAQDEGIDVPVNELVTALVRALEQSYLEDE